jgi:hypothetical protein
MEPLPWLLEKYGGSSFLLGMPKGGLGERCSPVFTDALPRLVYRVHRSPRFALFRGNSSALLSKLLSENSDRAINY